MRVSVTQHVETDRVENVIQYNRRCYDSTGCVWVMKLRFRMAFQCRQFLDKNFKLYVTICSPRVEHVWKLENVISNTCSNILYIIYYILYEQM